MDHIVGVQDSVTMGHARWVSLVACASVVASAMAPVDAVGSVAPRVIYIEPRATRTHHRKLRCASTTVHMSVGL